MYSCRFSRIHCKKRKIDIVFEGINVTSDMWLNSFKCTKEAKLCVIHWKTLHGIYPCNITLKRFRLRENVLCDTCNVDDTIQHHFIKCQSIRNIWNNFNNISDMNILGIEKCNNYKDILLAKRAIEMYNYKKSGNVYTYFELEKQMGMSDL